MKKDYVVPLILLIVSIALTVGLLIIYQFSFNHTTFEWSKGSSAFSVREVFAFIVGLDYVLILIRRLIREKVYSILYYLILIAGLFILLLSFSGYIALNESEQIIIGAFLFCDFLIILYVRFRYKQMKEMIASRDYNQMLDYAKRHKSLNKGHLNLNNEIFSYSLAVLCLENNDRENFEFYINQIKHRSFISFKYFWLAIQDYTLRNFEGFEANADLFFQYPCKLTKNWNGMYKINYYLLKEMKKYLKNTPVNEAVLTKIRDAYSNTIITQICTGMMHGI